MWSALRIDDDVMLFAALSVFDNAVDQVLLVAVVTLRKQDVLGSVGDTAPEGDIPGTASHYFYYTTTLVGCRGVSHFIDRLHSRIDCGIKADRIVRTCDIKIDGTRKADGIDPQRRQLSRTAEGAVSADHNDTVNAMLLTDLCAKPLAFFCRKFFTAGGIKDRAASVNGVGNAHTIHIYDLLLEKSCITTHDALDLEAFMDRCPNDRTDRCIHSRRISAACEYPDSFNLFFCHSLFLH